MNCLAKIQDNTHCKKTALGDGSKFCKFHQYMNEYTTEMLEAQKVCTGCRKMYYFPPDYEFKHCESCKNRTKTRIKKEVVKCSYSECNFKRSEENEYCGKHQSQLFVKQTQELGKKTCFNHIRGCREQLDISYAFAKCQNCLETERAGDFRRRQFAAANPITEDGRKICPTCCHAKDTSEFLSGTKETKTCKHCREMNAIQDAKRRRGISTSTDA
jgi:hypothetical protein